MAFQEENLTKRKDIVPFNKENENNFFSELVEKIRQADKEELENLSKDFITIPNVFKCVCLYTNITHCVNKDLNEYVEKSGFENIVDLLNLAFSSSNVQVIIHCILHYSCTEEIGKVFGRGLDNLSHEDVKNIYSTLLDLYNEDDGTQDINLKLWWKAGNEYSHEHLDYLTKNCPYDYESLDDEEYIPDFSESSESSESDDSCSF